MNWKTECGCWCVAVACLLGAVIQQWAKPQLTIEQRVDRLEHRVKVLERNMGWEGQDKWTE